MNSKSRIYEKVIRGNHTIGKIPFYPPQKFTLSDVAMKSLVQRKGSPSKRLHDQFNSKIPIVLLERYNFENNIAKTSSVQINRANKIAKCTADDVAMKSQVESKGGHSKRLNNQLDTKILTILLDKCEFGNNTAKKSSAHKNGAHSRRLDDQSIEKLPNRCQKMSISHENIMKNKLGNYHEIKKNEVSDSYAKKNLVHCDHINLRERKAINYNEESVNQTPNINKSIAQEKNGKVPIYKQMNSQNMKNKNHNEYDFIAESDEDKNSDISFHINTPKIKRRKIIQKDLMHKKALTNYSKDEKCVKTISRYEKKVNKILNNLCSNLKTIKSSETLKCAKNNTNIENSPTLKADQSTHLKTHQHKTEKKKIMVTDKTIFNSTQLENILNEDFFGNESPLISKGTNIYENNDQQIEIRMKPKTMSLNGTNCSSLQNSHGLRDSKNSDTVDYDFDFDFMANDDESKCNSAERRSNGNIFILQNIVLPDPTSSNRQSTKGSSWRCDINYTRNPHFLQIKNNALPSLNQEPILDHRFQESMVNTSKSIPPTKKSPNQKSILDYIKSNKEISHERSQQISLFDAEEFYSPITHKNCDKENISIRKPNPLRKACRRNILGVLDENIKTDSTSTPAKITPTLRPLSIDLSVMQRNDESENSESTFGFNCNDKIEEEMSKNEAAKPFRCDVNFRKQYAAKPLADKFTQPVRASELKRLVEDDEDFQAVVENDGLESDKRCLFDDIEVPHNITKSYKPRTRKKLGFEMDVSKKKNTQTKLSKEARQWIKQFNEMCSEVDKTELEIE